MYIEPLLLLLLLLERKHSKPFDQKQKPKKQKARVSSAYYATNSSGVSAMPQDPPPLSGTPVQYLLYLAGQLY
jgi:hypothetical protein